ncbi:MAG: tetratricopeptide repeat protein [Chloroflexia bacterium]
MDGSSDYTPRPPRKSGKRTGPGPDYTPRPARRERPGRPSLSSRPARKGKGRFLGSKAFWRLAAVVGLVILVGVPVLADLMQGRGGEVADFDGLVSQGHAYYEEALRAWDRGDRTRAARMFAGAADSYERALTLRPADADVRTELGTVYYYQGVLEDNPSRVEKAVQAWQTALSYEPDLPRALLNLGVGYTYLGRKEEAVALWQRVIEVAPDAPEAQEARRLLEEYGTP